MSKVPLNDWQTMQTRKEIEEFQKKVSVTDTINFTLMLELLLLFLGFCLDNIFNNSDVVCGSPTQKVSSVNTWLIVSVVSVALVILIWVGRAVYIHRKKRMRTIIKSAREIIDLFDNKVCFYIMTADSIDISEAETEDDIDYFYILEKSYYINKCVMILISIENNLKNAVTPNANENHYLSRKISSARMDNVITILLKIYEEIDLKLKDSKADRDIKLKKENDYYKKKLHEFKGTFMEVISELPV